MYVSPKKDCSHIKWNSFLSVNDFKNISFQNLKCENCSEISELWICITCGKAYCGRYVNNHYYENHYLKQKDHCICISMLDLSVWCYMCFTDGFTDPGSYIESPISSEYVKIISDFKFGDSNSISKNNINSTLNLSKEKSTKIKYDNFIELLKNNKFKNICFLVGPEINIDKQNKENYLKFIFNRTKEKYSSFGNINFDDLFSKELFLSNPELLYSFLKEYKLNEKDYINPNVSHYFIRYLIDKRLAYYVFTENIERNEVKTGILEKNVVYGRGNLLEGHCAKCNKKIDIKIINKGIEEEKVLKCDKCQGPCKPKIVLNGENTDKYFYLQTDNILNCDLIFVIGSDLSSNPFKEVTEIMNIYNPWIIAIGTKEFNIFNFEDLSSNKIFIKGNCEEIVKKIIKDCHWEDEMRNRYKINLE